MNRFPRPEAAHGLTMGAVLRIALATVIVSATVASARCVSSVGPTRWNSISTPIPR